MDEHYRGGKDGLFAIAVEAIPTAMMAIGAANLWENRSLGCRWWSSAVC